MKIGSSNPKGKNKGKKTKERSLSNPALLHDDDVNTQPLELIVDLSGKGRQGSYQRDIPLDRTTSASPVSTDTETESRSSGGGPKRKKARTTFTGKQIYEMERKFEVKKYLSSNERTEMARILNVTETQVCKYNRLRPLHINQVW